MLGAGGDARNLGGKGIFISLIKASKLAFFRLIFGYPLPPAWSFFAPVRRNLVEA